MNGASLDTIIEALRAFKFQKVFFDSAGLVWPLPRSLRPQGSVCLSSTQEILISIQFPSWAYIVITAPDQMLSGFFMER